MKATIEFNLPDEKREYDEIMNAQENASKFSYALSKIEEIATNFLKYNDLPVEFEEIVQIPITRILTIIHNLELE